MPLTIHQLYERLSYCRAHRPADLAYLTPLVLVTDPRGWSYRPLSSVWN